MHNHSRADLAGSNGQQLGAAAARQADSQRLGSPGNHNRLRVQRGRGQPDACVVPSPQQPELLRHLVCHMPLWSVPLRAAAGAGAPAWRQLVPCTHGGLIHCAAILPASRWQATCCA